MSAISLKGAKTHRPQQILGAWCGAWPLVGVAVAVANAVYHATGKRVREFPITLDNSCNPLPAPAQFDPGGRVVAGLDLVAYPGIDPRPFQVRCKFGVEQQMVEA